MTTSIPTATNSLEMGIINESGMPYLVTTEDHDNGTSMMNNFNQLSPISVQTDSSPPTGSTTTNDIIQNQNITHFQSDQVKTTASSSRPVSHRKSSDHIKRPMNAFLIWSTRRRHEIKEKEPQITMAEISKRLGQEWKDMTIDDRQPFIDQAKQIRADHMSKYPDYKYQPRRKKNPVGKVKTVAGTKGGPAMPLPNSSGGQLPAQNHFGQYNNSDIQVSAPNNGSNQLMSNAGSTIIYQTPQGQHVVARSSIPQQQLQYQTPHDDEHHQQMQVGNANLTHQQQQQQVVVTSPYLVPAGGGQPGYTVILPNQNGLPLYIQPMAQQQQQPQALVQQQQILASPQSGTLAQPPLQASPQLQAAVQHPQPNQISGLPSQLLPGNILVSGNSLHPIQTLTEGQVPFSQM